MRILSLNLTVTKQAASVKNTRKLILSSSRGYIYDRNFESLVNNRIYADTVKIGRNNQVDCVKVDRYSDNQLCAHLIGYVSSDGVGVSGLERSYNDVLSAYYGEEYITYQSSATGEVVGELPKTQTDGFLSKGGIVLTVDKSIQYAVEKCMDSGNIYVGAAVVLDVNTSEILAIASRPAFNPNDIKSALNDSNSPLINRALTAYSVGSVFKPIIAAVALENGVSPDYKYTCTGSIKVGDSVFNCHKKDGHGELNLLKATAGSCNTYYINLTKNIDSSVLLDYARNVGINSGIEIADSLYSEAGVLPELSEFSLGEKANFSFGQGKLTATPVAMAAFYAAIGNNGVYTPPIAVKSMVDNDIIEYKKAVPNAKKRIMSEQTAKTLLECLELTVKEGSGKNASSEIVTTAGKTATAQSGWYVEGKEITHSWFIGLFPVDSPKYCVCIIKENGKSGSSDCAPVFKSIAELIISYE